VNGHFTLNFYYYEPRFQQLGYILTLESVYTRDQRRCTEADRDPQNIWDREILRIFRRRYIVRILTSKTNISISYYSYE